MDWIDEEYQRRQQGIRRPLDQGQHRAVNARYEGCTLEYCCKCEAATGFAGPGDDSLYTEDDGPFCRDCFREIGGFDE